MADFLDFETLERPSSPNSFLLAPDGLCRSAAPDEVSPVFSGQTADAVYSRLLDIVAGERSMQVVAADEAKRRITAVAVTAILRFKDDVDMAVLDGPGDPPAPAVAIYSRSRVGYSDLGANAKRVRSLVKKLRLL